jgi:putative Holliday junction resolvase
MAEEPQAPRDREVRILALDVGDKRIGLAVSDPLGLTAQGLEVLTRQTPEADLARLAQVARHWGVQQIVVGLPRHLDGRLGTLAPQILELADALQKTLGVEVVTWEERLTTVEAERVLLQADLSRRQRRRVVDQLAAVLILQNYLDYRQQQQG